MLEYLVQFRYNIQYYINDSLRISDQDEDVKVVLAVYVCGCQMRRDV